MIGTVEVRVSAGHPEMPVRPIAVVQGSAATIGVVDVPKTRCGATVTGVAVAIENADGTVAAVEATLKGGVWCATFGAYHFATPGTVEGGLTITASGTAEDGTTQETWTIGKGDVDVLSADGVPVPGETLQYVKLHDTVPTTPKVGDLAKVSGVWKIYTTNGWQAFGGGSGGGAVSSVNGKTGEVVLDASDIRRDAGEEGTIHDALGDIEIALGEKVDTDDSRLTNARTPTAHTHTQSQITDFPQSMDPNAHASAHATGGSDAITPADIGAAAASHTHTQDQITDFGGPYLPTSGGELFKEGDFCILRVGGELSDIQGNKKMSVGKINVMGAAEEGEFIPSSITKDGKEVATEDQLPYPIASVTNGALNDRTVNTSTTGGTFTFPAKVGTKSRDFSLVIPEQSTAPSVSFPTTGVTYVSEQSASELWSAEANKINEWYFHENGANQFAVYHRAFSTVTQASS